MNETKLKSNSSEFRMSKMICNQTKVTAEMVLILTIVNARDRNSFYFMIIMVLAEIYSVVSSSLYAM